MNETDLLPIITHDQAVRKNIVAESHYWFFHFYLSRYVSYETAPFHREMIKLTEDSQHPLLIFMAFRGSGKSTILSLSYPLWALLGKKGKRFIMIISETQYQAQLLLHHIKDELEYNELLKKDFGPFISRSTQWSVDTIVIPRYNAKIIAASTEQSIRGIRHAEVRPDLIICDDIEDLNSVKTMDSRSKNFRWLIGDVIPTGDKDTQLLIVGNMLHEDSVLMRLQQMIDEDKIDGIIKKYPIIEDGKTLWESKFPDSAALEKEKRKIGNLIAWKREYELQITPEEGQVIASNDIKGYDTLPTPYEPPKPLSHYSEYEKAKCKEEANKIIRLEKVATGIDLAISQKDSADYTAMVTIHAFNFGDSTIKYYVMPHPINKRLSFADTCAQAEKISRAHGDGIPTKLYVEQVGYQPAAVESLKMRKLPVEGIPVGGTDKRARLEIVSPLIQQGDILFPKKGCEELIAQIVGFGVEKHDDLLDAFTLVIMQLMKKPPQTVRWDFGKPDGGTITKGLWTMQF